MSTLPQASVAQDPDDLDKFFAEADAPRFTLEPSLHNNHSVALPREPLRQRL